MRIYLCLVFFCIFSKGYAQTKPLSLQELRKNLRKTGLHDTLRIKTMLQIGVALSAQDSVMPALATFEQAMQLAQKTSFEKWKANAYLQLGQLHMKLTNYSEALQLLQNALNFYEKLKNYHLHTHCLQLIGKIHEIQQNYDRTLQYYKQALTQAEKHNLITQISFAYNNIGNAYFYKQEYKKAIGWQLKAIALRKAKDSLGIQYSYNDIAEIYMAIGKRDSALYYLQKSHYVAQKTGDSQLMAWGSLNLALALDSVGRRQDALRVAENGLQVAQKLHTKDAIASTARYLALAYKRLNRLNEATDMFELYAVYRDSLATEQRTKEIAKLETNHEIKKHTEENQRIKAEKDQQRYWLLALGAGIVLLLAVAGMLVRLNSLRRKTNILLESKNNEIQETNFELNEKNEEINQQKEELMIITENLERINQEMNQKNEDITASITYAMRIQQAILPTIDDIRQGFQDVFVFFQPRDLVSGDFYFFVRQGENHVLAMADCTGHGVPGALMSMVGNELLHEIVTERQNFVPATILAYLHKGIRKVLKQQETDNRDGMDIAIINYQTNARTLQYAGAKNPLVYIENGEVQYIKGNSWGIGGEQRETERIFTNHSLPTENISWVYMFSDGFQDQFGGEKNKKFSFSRLRQLLGELQARAGKEQESALRATFQNWRTEAGEKQIDDVSVLGVSVNY